MSRRSIQRLRLLRAAQRSGLAAAVPFVRYYGNKYDAKQSHEPIRLEPGIDFTISRLLDHMPDEAGYFQFYYRWVASYLDDNDELVDWIHPEERNKSPFYVPDGQELDAAPGYVSQVFPGEEMFKFRDQEKWRNRHGQIILLSRPIRRVSVG